MRIVRLLSLTLFCLVAVVGASVAADRALKKDYPVTKINDRIYVIYGPFDLPDNKNRGFRNTAVIVLTSRGVVVFDPGGSAYAGEMVVRKIRTLSKDPVVAIFNSHAHGDHWLGNEGVKRTYPQAVIYGHPGAKAVVDGAEGDRWLAVIERLTGGTAGGKKVIGPEKTVNNGDVIAIGDTSFGIHHTGPAHTDNDIMIEVVDQKALFTGDVVRNGMLGLMESDSSFKGNIAAIDWMVQKKFKHYIPGHGRAGGVEIVRAYRAYLDKLLTTVKKLYAKNLADHEMKPAVRQAVSAYKDWDGFERELGPHVNRAYLEVEAAAF